jgi:hypothetical protein
MTFGLDPMNFARALVWCALVKVTGVVESGRPGACRGDLVMVISMAIRVMEGGEFDSRARGKGNGDIGGAFGRVVWEEGRCVSMETSYGLEQREARGAIVERMVWTVSRQALERAALECFRQEKNGRRMGRDFGHTSKVVGGGGEVGSGGGAFVGGGS